MSPKLVNMGLVFLAAVSVVTSYAGLTTSIPQDSLWWKLLCAAIAIASGVAIYIFWRGAFEASVKPGQFRLRGAGWGATFLGCAFLLGMSSWWNVTAIGGREAMRAAIFDALNAGEVRLVSINASSTAYRPFLSRLDGLSVDFAALAECERHSGCVSGSAGTGGVSATLDQMKGKIDAIRQSVVAADNTVAGQVETGKTCLVELRTAIERDASIAESSSQVDCINTAMAAIAGNGQLERIAQELEGFVGGLVLPASVTTSAQKQAVANIFSGIKQRADAIASDARKAMSSDTIVAPVSVSRMSPMKAVIVFADEIIPSWITGVALDLLPLVLLSFSSTLAASKREQPDLPVDLTVADTLKALDALDKLDMARRPKAVDGEINPPDVEATPVRRITYRTDTDLSDHWNEWVEVNELYDDEGKPS